MAEPSIFDLTDRVAVITGGAGLLGRRHAEVLGRAGARCVLVDLPIARPAGAATELERAHGVATLGLEADITRPEEVCKILAATLARFGRVDILVNNAANNPKIEGDVAWSRLENFPIEIWNDDLRVGLTGAFLCSQVLGGEMARRGRGVILNIASDLALISPDQRLYERPNLPPEKQPVKPVTYSIVKTGLIGLTRYLATYWAGAGVRVNALSPGGVYDRQPEEFVQRLARLIPLGRMAERSEYQGAVLFLCSDASSYMTGANLVVDGGRTAW